ncbi:YbaN family protein [Aestuariispira ectoiniformans]|uniref:YbaN family protein n=1 Tax=Aestuariispira ectoiniformans TaxID=2775080 RepID=UPI00223B7562|nr:YbaN family protein [Aestuariispira ectoiniformans]
MTRATIRLIYLLIGLISTGLGIVGAFLPIMPTVPFLIVALWAFSRSSERFHNWLYHHRIYGPLLRDWDRYRVIPLWGKIWACVAMAGGLTITAIFFKPPVWSLVGTGIVMLAVAAYLISKPSHRPAMPEENG